MSDAALDLVIFGAGGYGREVCQVVEDINADRQTWNLLGFVDEDPGVHGRELRGVSVLGGSEWLSAHPGVAIAVAAGFPATRRKIARALARSGPREYPTLIHPLAWIGNYVSVGDGTVVLAGATISTDTRIGSFGCLNKNCIVGHDAVIGDHVTISPGASISGGVVLGEGCDIGANSVVVQGVRVGDWTVLGAGGVAARDLPPNVTAVGVPARIIKERPAGWYDA